MISQLRTPFRKLRRIPGVTISFLKALNTFRKRGGIVRPRIVAVRNEEALHGKTVLITGGSHGIGYAIARKFIDCGARVVITGRHQAALVEAVAALGSDAVRSLVWDISDVASVEARIDETEALLGGGIDILVNNAGVLLLDGFLDVSEENWDKTHAVNSRGLFFLTQALCRRWIAAERSPRKVIMVASTSGFLPDAYPYRLSKWDLVGLTQGLAVKLAKHDICVNGIAPGRVAGRMLGVEEANISDAEIPMGRVALPEEIAELAFFLASDASNYVTGQTIICDGGRSLQDVA